MFFIKTSKFPISKKDPKGSGGACLSGLPLDDPYGWLEKENEEVTQWDSEQNLYTDTLLAKWPYRQSLRRAVFRSMTCGSSDPTILQGAENNSDQDWRDIDHTLDFDSKLPFFTEEYIFYCFHPRGCQQTQLLVYKRKTNSTSVLIDPNRMEDQAGLDWFSPSPNGKYVAYGLSSRGDEQSRMGILETKTGLQRGEPVLHTSFAHVSWRPDSSGFYYSGGTASDRENADKYLYSYDLSQARPEGPDLLPRSDPHLRPILSGNGRYLVVNFSWEKPCAAYVCDLQGDKLWKPLLEDHRGESFGCFRGEEFFALTSREAPRGKILSIPMETVEDRRTWREIVPPGDSVIQHFTVVEDAIIISELVDACSRLRIVSRSGQGERIIPLPGFGLIESPGSPDECPFSVDGTEVYFCYTSFIAPTRLYRLDLKTHSLDAMGKDPAIDHTNIEVRRLACPSRDGQQIICFLVSQASREQGDASPLLIHGYGGWNTNLAPSYIGSGRSCVLPFIEAGGIYVYACLRGGCELGRDWWIQGRREHKQNTFNDLYDVSESLIDQGLTSPDKLAIMGASNGGLLTAVAAVQRPDLFRVVLSEVPLTDMVRALKDPFLSSYTVEYGSPEDPEMLPVLLGYSPVHNVKQGTPYPAVFLLSGRDDIRCQVWNGRKLAALLQDATSSSSPVVLKVMEGGHGPGISMDAKVERRTDLLCFLMQELDMKMPLDDQK